MTTAKATPDSVHLAAESLLQDGLSIESINARKICEKTGGSFSTISPLLAEWKELRCNEHNLEIPMPSYLSSNLDTMLTKVWYVAVKEVRAQFQSEINECNSLKDDLDLCSTEIVTLESEITRLSEQNKAETTRFLIIIDALKEVFYSHSGKVNDAISEGEQAKIMTVFNTFHKALDSKLKLSISDQQAVLSDYINNLDIEVKETCTATDDITIQTGLKESAEQIEQTIADADNIN